MLAVFCLIIIINNGIFTSYECSLKMESNNSRIFLTLTLNTEISRQLIFRPFSFRYDRRNMQYELTTQECSKGKCNLILP